MIPMVGKRSRAAPNLVELDPDHPGFRDAAYRKRRNAIAAIALAHHEGEPVPRIDYLEEEHEVWRNVWAQLAPMQAAFACKEYLRCSEALALDQQRIPQLADLNPKLEAATGFQMIPVAGLVASRDFLSSLERGLFLSTQYIRHHSRPFYTPEPDVVHELAGHAATLATPELAHLNRAFGACAAVADEEKLAGLGQLYWYTLEFGVLREEGQPKAYGAGLLSSFGELSQFSTAAVLEPLDFAKAAASSYDPTQYQKRLFVAPSMAYIVTELPRWIRAWVGLS